MFVKRYGFWFFEKSICKILSKYVSGKCGQKRFDHTKISATNEFRTILKRVI